MPIHSETFQLLAVLKQIHTEVGALRKEIDELRDEVKVIERDGGIRFVFNGESDEDESSSDDSDDTASVQSAPPTVSYELNDYGRAASDGVGGGGDGANVRRVAVER